MAYYGYEFYYDGLRATWFGYLCTALVNMGWELHDEVSSTCKVYKSNGESGEEPYGYIWIDAGTSTYVEMCAYQHWNATTHVGTRARRTNETAANCRLAAATFQTTVPALICGNKDLVIASPSDKYTGNTTHIVFGHIANRTGFVVGVHGTAGTAGTLTVASTAGFGVGQRVQIVGTNGYIENTHISEVVDSSTVIVNSLAGSYGTGSKMGTPASTFGITNGPTYYAVWYPVSVWGDSGTAGTSTLTYTVTPVTAAALYAVLPFSEKKYVLAPIFVWLGTSGAPGAVIGSVDDDFVALGTVTTDWDAAIANSDCSFATSGTGSFGTASSSGTASLIDSSKAWGTDELIGKFCVITGGSGTAAGGIKKITGNNATSFTADSNWGIQPVSGSIYVLTEYVRRGCRIVLGSNCYILLTSTTAPS